MKLYHSIIALAAVSVLAACTKKEAEIPQQNYTQSATLPAAGKKVWSAGDAICLGGHPSSALQEGGSATATFSFPGLSLPEGSAVNVLCNGDGSACHFYISPEATYDDASSPVASAPLWGASTAGKAVDLHNVCSMISLELKGTGDVSSVLMTSKGGEMISGLFELGYSSGAFNGSFTGGSSTSLKIAFKTPVSVAQGGTLITVPVPAGLYTRGLTASVYNSSGRYMTMDVEAGTYAADSVMTVSAVYNPDSAVESLEDYDENSLFDTGSLTVGSYNILNSTGRGSSPNTWEAAKSTIASIIMNMDCDIMTVNELGATEIKYLKETLSGYSFVTKPNSASGTYSYAPGILYRTTRLEKLDDGIFWLSDPDAETLVTKASSYSYMDPVDSTVYTASNMRCCVWGRFKDNESGRTFYWFATHPHIRGNDSSSSLANTIYCLNAGNIRSLLKQIPYVNTSGEPQVVAGDMNTWSQHVSYPLFGEAGLSNAFDAAVESGVIDSDTATRPGTCPGLNPQKFNYAESQRIDHVFYRGFVVRDCRNIYTKYYNSESGYYFHPSDHIPVKAKLTTIK